MVINQRIKRMPVQKSHFIDKLAHFWPKSRFCSFFLQEPSLFLNSKIQQSFQDEVGLPTLVAYQYPQTRKKSLNFRVPFESHRDYFRAIVLYRWKIGVTTVGPLAYWPIWNKASPWFTTAWWLMQMTYPLCGALTFLAFFA
jgi:hypothetical protein